MTFKDKERIIKEYLEKHNIEFCLVNFYIDLVCSEGDTKYLRIDTHLNEKIIISGDNDVLYLTA